MKRIFSERHINGYGLIPYIYKENINQLIDKVEELEKEINELKNARNTCKLESVPVASIPDLIYWLSQQKYVNVDENSDNMTEEFEKEHQWELSRNCFINKVIRYLEQL